MPWGTERMGLPMPWPMPSPGAVCPGCRVRCGGRKLAGNVIHDRESRESFEPPTRRTWHVPRCATPATPPDETPPRPEGRSATVAFISSNCVQRFFVISCKTTARPPTARAATAATRLALALSHTRASRRGTPCGKPWRDPIGKRRGGPRVVRDTGQQLLLGAGQRDRRDACGHAVAVEALAAAAAWVAEGVRAARRRALRRSRCQSPRRRGRARPRAAAHD